MIPGIRQFREERVHGATGDFAVPGDDGSPLADGDLDGVEQGSGVFRECPLLS